MHLKNQSDYFLDNIRMMMMMIELISSIVCSIRGASNPIPEFRFERIWSESIVFRILNVSNKRVRVYEVGITSIKLNSRLALFSTQLTNLDN